MQSLQKLDLYFLSAYNILLALLDSKRNLKLLKSDESPQIPLYYYYYYYFMAGNNKFRTIDNYKYNSFSQRETVVQWNTIRTSSLRLSDKRDRLGTWPWGKRCVVADAHCTFTAKVITLAPWNNGLATRRHLYALKCRELTQKPSFKLRLDKY